MFIRIAWQKQPTTAQFRTLRPVSHIPRRGACDDLGVPPRDFEKMTKGLFDRQG